jgi:hypothetical protein
MDRKKKEKEYFAYHANTFKNLKLASPNFTLKMAFYEKGKFGRNIQLYEGELKRNEDLYMEFIDTIRDDRGNEVDYSPMLEDRPLFKFKANPFFAEEYELRERSGGYSVYIISVSELMVIQKDGTEISYALYEKRKEEQKAKTDSLPKLQSTLSVFPDFEEETLVKKSDLSIDITLEDEESVSDILNRIAKDFQKLALKFE